MDSGCTICGGIILADTENFKKPLCYECYIDTRTKTEENNRFKIRYVFYDCGLYIPALPKYSPMDIIY